MIYSRWRPDRGGYDYFESPERFGLADDLSVPRLSGGSSIGVASVSVGREATGSLTPAGAGPVARGMILPTSRSGLKGLGFFGGFSTWALVGLGAVSGFVVGRVLRGR